MMQARRHVSIVLALSVALMPRGAAAQQARPDEPALWHRVVEQLPPASFVSVRLADGSRVKGTILDVGEDDFTLKLHTRIPVAARTIGFAEVVSVQPHKTGMSPGRKVITGIGIGVATYLLLVAVALAGGLD